MTAGGQKVGTDLPASLIADRLNQLLHTHPTVVVTAPPGAGKSTLLPLTIMDGLGGSGRILVLEPRRLAARQIAARMAQMIGEPVGQTVGYHVRFDSCVSSRTRIEVLTEGILTRMLITDSMLDGVDAVIFDEFHERSIHTDVALALTRTAQQIIRPDLRIILMSATIDTTSICQQLDAPLLQSEGRMFPVDVHYATDDIPQPYTPSQTATLVARQVLEAHRHTQGDILVFLPGEAEIRHCHELLQDALGDTRICPLYGQLPHQLQQQAISPATPGHRRVVLSTPIAETSLTIQGVRVVVDSGLCRRMVFDARTGLSHLATMRISMDMARQRTGRAGRVEAGICYRMWTRATEVRMAECRQPEIAEADLAPMMLDIAAWGEAPAASLPWLTPPPTSSMVQANALLQWLDAVDAEGHITPHGRTLSQWPCHPRIAQMMDYARHSGATHLAADVAAILESPSTPTEAQGTDIHLVLESLAHARRHHAGRWAHTLQAADHYLALMGSDRQPDAPTADAALLLAQAYPERIAHLTPEGCGRYLLASGDPAVLDHQDPLCGHPWLVVAHMNAVAGGRVFLAAPIEQEQLTPWTRQRDYVSWDNRQGTIVAERQWHIGRLILRTAPLTDIPRTLISDTIAQAVTRYGSSMLDLADDSVQQLQCRMATLAQWHPEHPWPDLSTPAILSTAPRWLPMYIDGMRTVAQLRRLPLADILWSLVPYELQSLATRLAPTHVQLPSGRRARLEYRQGAEHPILRIRLQECFGMMDTPRVDDGKRPILMELLSPGFKPVQLTQDLRSFWSSTYFDVRKELRRRYPRHQWPEDPTDVPPRTK